MTLQINADSSEKTSRREFLKKGTVAVVAGSAAANLTLNSSVYAAGSDVLRVGLVGCGGRGTGAAAQALRADKNTQLVAMGDAFGDRLEKSLKLLQNNPVSNQIAVDDNHKFSGFDAYKKVIESSDVVLLATPPHFRPEHLRAVVEAGKHCFVEKPVAVDARGIHSVLATCERAKEKNLSIVSGLCWRYHNGMRDTSPESTMARLAMSLRCNAVTTAVVFGNHEPPAKNAAAKWSTRCATGITTRGCRETSMSSSTCIASTKWPGL